MRLFDFLFEKTKDIQKPSSITTYATYRSPEREHIFTDNELEVLKRIRKYTLGQKSQGIVNKYHKNIPELIHIFIDKGLMQNETIEDSLNRLKVSELKALLENHNLKTIGKKTELIQRVLSEVPVSDYEDLIDVKTYYVSQAGKTLLEEYEVQETKKRFMFESSCVKLINNREISMAYQKICEWRSTSANGSMIDWQHELKQGLGKHEESQLTKHLDFSDKETDTALSENKVLFNACCIYFYLSGINPNGIIKTYRSIAGVEFDTDTTNKLMLRAHMLINIMHAKRDLHSYKTSKAEKYQVMCAYDKETCDECAQMDMKIYSVKDAKISINYPPFHKECRCTTVPHYDDSDFFGHTKTARDANGKSINIPASMNYLEYKKQYLDK